MRSKVREHGDDYAPAYGGWFLPTTYAPAVRIEGRGINPASVSPVFLTPEGGPWRDERISPTFSRVVRAGIKGLSVRVCREMRFHDLRHTCAVTMLRGGASLHEVRDQLGHSSIQVTEEYAKYVLGSTKLAAAAMDRMIE